MNHRTAILQEVISGLRKSFDGTFHDPLLRNINIGTEYQLIKESFPLILVGYNEQELRNAGLGHIVQGIDPASGSLTHFGQWYFQGTITFSILGMTVLERDTLADEIINVVGFGRHMSNSLVNFHNEIDESDFINLSIMEDRATPSGNGVLQAPWGASNEQLYYTGYGFACAGTFFSDSYTPSSLARLSHVAGYPYRNDQPIPTGTADIAPWPSDA